MISLALAAYLLHQNHLPLSACKSSRGCSKIATLLSSRVESRLVREEGGTYRISLSWMKWITIVPRIIMVLVQYFFVLWVLVKKCAPCIFAARIRPSHVHLSSVDVTTFWTAEIDGLSRYEVARHQQKTTLNSSYERDETPINLINLTPSKELESTV